MSGIIWNFISWNFFRNRNIVYSNCSRK